MESRVLESSWIPGLNKSCRARASLAAGSPEGPSAPLQAWESPKVSVVNPAAKASFACPLSRR